MQPILRLAPVQSFLKRRIDRGAPGPDQERRSGSDTQLWGEARSADGRVVSATMTTPNGYDVTVTASLGIVQHLLEQEAEGGFYTPSLLVGPEFVLSLPNVQMAFVEASG